MQKSRLSQEYLDGVQNFLNFAFHYASEDNRILCPCLKCANIDWHMREIVYEHLVCFGFLPGYTRWYFHGESIPSRSYCRVSQSSTCNSQHQSITQDDIEGMLQDAFNMHNHNSQTATPKVSDFIENNVRLNNSAEMR